MNSHKNLEVYDGAENSIVDNNYYNGAFTCPYDGIKTFPFGHLTCSFHIQFYGSDSKATVFDLDKNVFFIGKNTVNQYNILGVSGSISESKEEIEVTFKLSSDFQSVLLVTYLPTILMNIINQAVVYVSEYDIIITVNITCMMVLTSVYLSVSSSLPSTANIKPVELWLLFNLAYPFLVIITNTLLEVFIIESALNSKDLF